MMVAAACGGTLDGAVNDAAGDTAVAMDAATEGYASADTSVADREAIEERLTTQDTAPTEDRATRETSATDSTAVDGAVANSGPDALAIHVYPADAALAVDATDAEVDEPRPVVIYTSPPRRSVWS